MKAALWILTLTLGIVTTAFALPPAIRSTNIVLPRASEVLDVVPYDTTLEVCHNRLKDSAPADVRGMAELFPFLTLGFAKARLDSKLESGASSTEVYLLCKLAPTAAVQKNFR